MAADVAGKVISVVVADDNFVVRQGLVSVLALHDEVRVVAEAADGLEAVTAVRHHHADVALFDMRMPNKDGLWATEQVADDCAVLVITYSDDGEMITAALKAGATGYLIHGRFCPDQLMEAIRSVHRGDAVFSPVAANHVLNELRDTPTARPTPTETRPFDLTAREHEVMNLIAHGDSNTQIAEKTRLREKTVKNYINRIYAKLGAERRAQAIAIWLGINQMADRS